MEYLIGTSFMVAAIAAAAVSAVGYTLVPFGYQQGLIFGRIGVRAALGAVLLVVVFLNYLFIAQRYDIEYVYNYSSAELEPYFRVAAVWAGQPGSFVIWALWGVIAAQFLVRRTRANEPYVLSVFMIIQTALLIFMLIRNPFIPHVTPNGVPPGDGKGLNPTLHNIWMLIHPPILFVGFALAAVPFAFAIGGIWRRDYDGWVKHALPWATAAWSFLGLALLLGGYWAYETLGWGGYWGWDPVENSALVPWLTVTALLHAMLVQRANGALRRTTMLLAIGTYVLVFYATFLTRSGVLSNFSVHSFVEEGLKWIMTSFLALLAFGSLVVFLWRHRDVPSRSLSERLLSRDSFFVLMIIALLVIAGVVALGTSMPVISAIPGVGHSLQSAFGSIFTLDDGTTYGAPGSKPFEDGRFGLAGSFYVTTVPPLALILVALLIIGPLLGWRDTNVRHLLRALRWPALGAVVVTCIALVLGARSPLPIAYIGLCAFAFGTNLLMIIRTLRSGWMRIGGYLAHVGLAVLLTGAAASSYYATPDQRLLIPEGETINMLGYAFTFNGWQLQQNGRGVLDLTVAKGGASYHATPQLYFNQRMGGTMATPWILSELFQDLYVSPAEYNPPVDHNVVDLNTGDTKTIGPYSMTFLGFAMPEAGENARADVGARLRLVYEGKATEIVPSVVLLANEPDPAKAVRDAPVALPGGHRASMAAFDPSQSRVIIRVDGLNLPVEPGKAVVTVSLKPGVVLVWLGVGIGVLGGLIAMLRRSREGKLLPNGHARPLPRGLAGLFRNR